MWHVDLQQAFRVSFVGRSIWDEYLRFTLVILPAVLQIWVVHWTSSIELARLVFPWLRFV